MSSKKETCEKVMDEFFLLDKDERLPFSSSLHLLRCKECRTKIRLMTKAEKLSFSLVNSKSVIKNGELSAALETVQPKLGVGMKPVSFFNWVLSGILMIAFFLVTGIFTRDIQSQNSLVCFYIAFAVVVSSYCALFVAANMDFFIKKIDTDKLFSA